MFVKVYEFHIQEGREREYLMIQEKTAEIYSRYIDCQTLYLKSINEGTKWLEISQYKDKDTYEKWIALVNKDPEIQTLFSSFEDLLDLNRKEIKEDSYHQVPKR